MHKNNTPKRLSGDEVTSAWRLDKHNIYYYNKQDKPKYRKAELVIFGMKQYHQPPPRELISKILSIIKDISNVDICLDLPYKPNLAKLDKLFTLKPYITNHGVVTDTSYINDTGIPMIDKITIYNKAQKNVKEIISLVVKIFHNVGVRNSCHVKKYTNFVINKKLI